MPRFWIDVYNRAGLRLGSGPVATVRSSSITRRLSRTGAISTEISAFDPHADLIVPRRRLAIMGQLTPDGPIVELGAGSVESVEQSVEIDGNVNLRIEGPDLIGELAERSVQQLVIDDSFSGPPSGCKLYAAGSWGNVSALIDSDPLTGADLPLAPGHLLMFCRAATFDGLQWDVVTPNTTTTAQIVYYRSATGWPVLKMIDGTSVGGKTLAQSGEMTWEIPPDWTPYTHEGVTGYWVQFHVPVAMAGLYVSEVRVTDRGQPSATGPAQIMALLPEWSLDLVNGYGETRETVVARFFHASVQSALLALAERTHENFRAGTGRSLVWLQDDYTSSGIRAVQSGNSVAMEENPLVCLIRELGVRLSAAEIGTRFYPYGTGQAENRLTLARCTRVPPAGWAIDYNLNYLANTALEADPDYGVVDLALSFPEIGPITNSDQDLQNAANALYDACYAEALRRITPQRTYQVSVEGLQRIVYPGETLRVICHRWADVLDRNWEPVVPAKRHVVNIDQDLYILESGLSVDQIAGLQTTRLIVSDQPSWPADDGEWTAQRLEEARAFQSHPQLSLCYAPVGPHVRRIDPTHDESFTVRIGSEVLAANRAILRFKTSPLVSSVSAASGASGGGTTATSTSGGGTTATSTSGGGTTATSASGGSGSASSSTEPTTAHQHQLTVDNGSAGGAVTYDGTGPLTANGYSGTLLTSATDVSHTHSVSLPGHTHDVTVGNHSHDVTVGNHSHDVTVGNHDHAMSMTYGLHADTIYPQGIHIAINGTDRTAALGGTWAPTNASVEAELDITQYLVNATGGLRQDHQVTFSCDAGQGEVEAEVDLMLTVQAIVVV